MESRLHHYHRLELHRWLRTRSPRRERDKWAAGVSGVPRTEVGEGKKANPPLI